MRSVVIVGASLAGLSAARSLRRQGFDGAITLVGDEVHAPYQRPPLSKQFLSGAFDRARLDLRVGNDLALDWCLGARAVELDLARREIELDDARRLPFDGLVIATGARPRKPRWYGALEGVYTLRTVDDAEAIRAKIASGARTIAIVGAGFIGCETAATLRGAGCDVTLIDVDRLPMLRVLGETLGAACLHLHESHGVTLALGTAVDGFVGEKHVQGVRLADGTIIAADAVIVGVGVTPNVEWLAGSGVTLDDGVVCDATCAVRGVPRAVAAGDVARWDHPYYGPRRVEHWNNAIAQADHAARTLLAGPAATPYAAIPFFWSDQYDRKLQLVGTPRPEHPIQVVEGGLDAHRFVALFEHEGAVTGAMLCNSMHRVPHYTDIVEAAARGAEHQTA